MIRTRLFTTLLAACWASAAFAQPPDENAPTAIIVRPASEPSPALKYRLVHERRTTVPGNAAVFYHRAIQLLIQRRSAIALKEKAEGRKAGLTADERVYQWISGPIAKIPKGEARELLGTFADVLREVELGSSRASCDWEFERRPEGISLMLPEIQETRSLVRLVALRAKLAILDGHVDEAMSRVQTGMAMGRHISDGPIVIQALVGVAVEFSMVSCLQELIQVPGMPSLYWAFADRPRPFIDLRPSLEGERYMLEKELPGLADLEIGPWGLDQARRFADDLQRKIYEFSIGPIPGHDGSLRDEMATLSRQTGVALMCAKIYPDARKALIASGLAEPVVDAMPVVQVATLQTYREFCRIRDERFKWMNLPYWASSGRVDRPMFNTVHKKLDNVLLFDLTTILPALNSARLSVLRLERQLDAMQCIEAIRLDAAAHGGKLPRRLDDLKDSPAPLDVLTGNPFAYEVEGETATLKAPVPPAAPNVAGYTVNYALKLAR